MWRGGTSLGMHEAWVWTQLPASQPAVQVSLGVVSVHGVLSGTGGCVHRPVPGLHGGSSVHSFVSGVHTVVMCVWLHTNAPVGDPIGASQPACVHKFPSVSVQGVLAGLFGCSHSPFDGLHGGSLVHWLLSGLQTVTTWFWSQTNAPVGELGLGAQPAKVHALLSVSPHGVLSGLLVKMH